MYDKFSKYFAQFLPIIPQDCETIWYDRQPLVLSGYGESGGPSVGVNNYLDKNLKTICYPISNTMAIVGKNLITYEPDSSDLVFNNMEENQKK